MRLISALCAALTLLPGTAFGWGCKGHETIALIARAHLTPRVAEAVNRLLKDNPLDPGQKRYCQDRPADPMADAATWADDMKSVDKTFNWHFIDVPMAVRRSGTEGGDPMQWCEPVGPSLDGKDRPGCLLTAIDYEWNVLRDSTQPGPDRAKALRYLIHFLGDLSQPLHDTDNHDRGGNCTQLAFLDSEKPENLHAIWDERMIGRDLQRRGSSEQRYAEELDREFGKNWPRWGEAETDITAWVWEGHEVARETVYGKLQPAIPVAPAAEGQTDTAGCALGRAQVGALHITAGEEYFHAALPVVRQQLAKAAYRLAGLLNRSF